MHDSTCDPTAPVIWHAFPVCDSIDQFNPDAAGNGSFTDTPVAAPVPTAELLATVTVNPTVAPASTDASSAVFVRSRSEHNTDVVALALWVGLLVEVRVAVFGNAPQEAKLVGDVTCTA